MSVSVWFPVPLVMALKVPQEQTSTARLCRLERGSVQLARWVMSEGLLSQFLLAKEQIECAEKELRGDAGEVLESGW